MCGENLVYSKGGEPAKKQSWLVDFIGKRIVLSNEMKMQSPLDGNMIKIAASGGDKVVGRKNYQNEMSFYLLTSCFLMCNDIPVIEPTDDAVKNRVRISQWNVQFVEKEKVNGKTRLLRDDEIKDKIDTIEWQHAFLKILCEAYKEYARHGLIEPKDMMEIRDTWLGGSSIEKLLFEEFEAVDNVREASQRVENEDYVKFSRIYNTLKRMEGFGNMSQTKLGRELTKMGFDNWQKKIDKCGVACRVGLKPKSREEYSNMIL